MVLLLPDGVEMEVPIEHMVVKDSIFIPTLRPIELRNMLQSIAKKLEMEVTTKSVIEDGYLGMMVWRVH
jgi:hypothetical protein